MYLLTLLTLIGAAVAVPLTSEQLAQEATTNSAAYVLPKSIIPTFYDVSLFFDPGNEEYFTGAVDIRVIAFTGVSEIILHAMKMKIDQGDIEIYSDSDLENNLYGNHTFPTAEDDDTHFLRIQLKEPLRILHPHTIKIKKFEGQYAVNMFGVYVSTYGSGTDTQKLITSQLQPTYARSAFPCFDEPFFKAVFRTTIYAPPAYTVVTSNMPERTDLLKPNVAGWLKYEFQDTLIMSSYLNAYLVSNLGSIKNTVTEVYDIPMTIYSRPGTQNTAEFALDFAQKNMVELENYMDFKYEFPKLDKAAVPDFAAGAMENWGLVIYREVALLIQDGVTTTASKQNVARIICHENVHQWFGNEVSPVSWTYTWLNEGFANLFENYATDMVLPEWRMMHQFVLNLQNVFQSDAVLGVNPMTYEVYTPSEVISTFNAVAYQKSGSVLRMTEHFLTPEVFRKGLSIYVKANTRTAVTPLHLYAALQQAVDESDITLPVSVQTIMERWVNQGGFPVLTATRSAATGQSIVVDQERFLTDNTLKSSFRWYVPINWVLSTNPDFSDTSPQGWVPPFFPARSYDIPGLSNAAWYILNKQETGYYRVNYDEQNWAALAQALNDSHTTIHVLNRAQLLDDAFNLARNGRLHYEYAFRISVYLDKEKDYIPWGAINPSLTYLNTVLRGSNGYDLFQKYILHLTAPLYDELKFTPSESDEHVTPFHRNIILNLNCLHGNTDCTDQAEELLKNYVANPTANNLNPDIQTLVFCSGLRGGNVDNFNFLWERYLASTDSSEQSILLNSLGCTSNEERRTFYLNQVISEDSPVRDQDRHSIIVSVINSSPENTEAALDFVTEHFNAIKSRVQGLSGTTNILNAFSRVLTTEEHSEKVEEFHDRYVATFTSGELASVNAIRANIASSIAWTKQNSAAVVGWLSANYGSGATAIVSSVIALLFSVIVAIFNH